MPHSHSPHAQLSSCTPAFVQAPTFVFARTAPTPSRSEMLRLQIIAAQETRRPLGW